MKAMTPSLAASSASLIGPRPSNEDRVFAWTNRRKGAAIVALADGMGGHAGGEAAATAAINTVERFALLLEASESSRQWMQSLFEEANRRVRAIGLKHGSENAGSTLVVAVVTRNVVTIGHIGDSRAYLVDDNGIHPLTRDHTVGEDAIERGLIERAHIQDYALHGALLRSLGASDNCEVEVSQRNIDPGRGTSGQVILLCSDGVWGVFSDADLLQSVRGARALRSAADVVVHAAEERSTTDNASIVILEVGKFWPAPKGLMAGGPVPLKSLGATVAIIAAVAVPWMSHRPNSTQRTPPLLQTPKTVWLINSGNETVTVRSNGLAVAQLSPGFKHPLRVAAGDVLSFSASPDHRSVRKTITASTPDTIRVGPL